MCKLQTSDERTFGGRFELLGRSDRTVVVSFLGSSHCNVASTYRYSTGVYCHVLYQENTHET